MEYMTTSGRAAMELGARLGRLGTLAVGAEGGLAWMLARCAGCGAALSGADVLFHDGSAPSVGAWLARHYDLPASLYFLDADGCARVWLCDGQGRALPEDRLPPAADWTGPSGNWDRLCGADSARAARAAGDRLLTDFPVCVEDGPGQKPLRLALERLTGEVLDRPRPGVPLLRSDRTGFCLTVRDGRQELHPLGRDAADAAVRWCVGRAARPLRVPAFGQEHSHRKV